MWFEIIPSFAIVSLALAAPGYAIYGLHKLVLGNPYRRGMEERSNRMDYQRDRRLSVNGNPYEQNGLEVIPDE